jgi:hypothetical protein
MQFTLFGEGGVGRGRSKQRDISTETPVIVLYIFIQNSLKYF